jgi:hypothetical protein
MVFKRILRKVNSLCDEKSEHFDCDNCLWPGATVIKGDIESAHQQFDNHDCGAYINAQVS